MVTLIICGAIVASIVGMCEFARWQDKHPHD